MAVTLQITDGTTTIDFTTTAGHLLADSYLPTFAMPAGDGTIPPYITETIPVIIRITSGNNFASTMQSFHALQLVAIQFAEDETYITPVWFHRQLVDESGAIRFLVRSMHFTPSSDFGGPLDDAPILTDGRTGILTVEHHPYGERTSAEVASTGTNLSVLGGSYAYSTAATVVGDVPARLYYARLYGGSGGIEFKKIWMGLRSDAKCSGDAVDFVSKWECEVGSSLSNANLAADATASPGGGGNTKLEVAPGAAWQQNFYIDIDTIDAGNPDAFNGTFLVLLRAKVDAGTTQVKMKRYLVDSSGPAQFGSVVDIAATSWTVYNLGLATFPTVNRRAFPLDVKDSTHDRSDVIGLWSRDKPGDATTTLDCDCFVLIPVDEYFIYIHYTSINDTLESWTAVAPDDELNSNSFGTTGADYWHEPSPAQIIGAGIPVGTGRLFICVANASDAAPAYDDDIDVTIQWFPRWISYRGAE